MGFRFGHTYSALNTGANESHNDNALALVLDGNNGRLQYIRMRCESGFDLAKFDAEAAPLHLAVKAAKILIASIGSYGDAVSSAVITDAVQRNQATRGFFRAIPITTHQRIAAG